jgi:hypothetical protein
VTSNPSSFLHFGHLRFERQLLVGMLDEDAEQGALDFQTGLMDVGLDRVGEPVVLGWQGEGQLELEPDGDGLILRLARLEGNGSLGVVGGAHGEPP